MRTKVVLSKEVLALKRMLADMIVEKSKTYNLPTAKAAAAKVGITDRDLSNLKSEDLSRFSLERLFEICVLAKINVSVKAVINETVV